MSIMVLRVILSFMHRVKAKCDKMKVNRLISKKQSSVFKRSSTEGTASESDVFSVYYDESNEEMIMEQSSRQIGTGTPRIRLPRESDNRLRKSSVKDVNVFRGFNYTLIKEMHQVAQGVLDIRDLPDGRLWMRF